MPKTRVLRIGTQLGLRMKRLLSGLLSLSITFASLPTAAKESKPIVVDSSAWTGRGSDSSDLMRVESYSLPETKNRVAGTMVITYLTEKQNALIPQMAKLWNVITFSKGKADRLASQLDGKTQNIVYAEDPEQVPLFQKAKQGLAKRLSDAKQKLSHRAKHNLETAIEFQEKHDKAVPVVIAFVPAIGYGTFYFVATADWMAGAKAFGLGYLVALGVGLFSKQWLAFSKDKVGGAIAGGVLSVAKKFGTSISEMAQERLTRFGQVLSAYGLNVLMAAGLMQIGGLLVDSHAFSLIFLYALFANHDVIDYKHEQHFGSRVAEMVAPWRILAFVPPEVLALMGYHHVEHGMGVMVATVSLSIIFKEEFGLAWDSMKEFARVDAQAVGDTYRLARDTYNRVRSKLKNWVAGKTSSKAEKICESDLATSGATIADAQ